MSHDRVFISRREFLEATALGGAIDFAGFGQRLVKQSGEGRWRVPLRVTERAGVNWRGERTSIGVVVPPQCAARAAVLKDESTGELLPFSAGYGKWEASGHLRWFQLSVPLHLAAETQRHLIVELIDDSKALGAVAPAPIGMETTQSLEVGTSEAGIRWAPNLTYGIYPSPTIGGNPLSDAPTAWSRIAIGDLSAPNGVTGGHMPLESSDTARLFVRIPGSESTVVDYHRTLSQGAYGAGYEIRQIYSCDLPRQGATERPYALCDIITFVHAGKDGVPLEVEGLSFLLGSSLRDRFVWQARGDAADPAERKRNSWQGGLMLPPGDWMMVSGAENSATLVIPWSAYTLDGYNLSYFVGRTETIAIPGGKKINSRSLLGGDASEGLTVALSHSYYRLNWGPWAGSDWGRNTYEFRCRLAWGRIDESMAARLARAYRHPPRVEVGEPERVSGSVALRCWPDHFTYAPGDHVHVEIEATTAAPAGEQAIVGVQVQHRGRRVGAADRTVLERVSKQRLQGVWTWPAPEAGGGGYLITAHLVSEETSVRSPAVPIEVLRRPQDLSLQIRMGNIAEMYPDRDVEILLDRFVHARINGEHQEAGGSEW